MDNSSMTIMDDTIDGPLAHKARIIQALEKVPEPPRKALRMKVDELKVCEDLFQYRDLADDEYRSRKHIKELADAIGGPKGPAFLAPLLVWWGGDGWYVIDGHHRLEAYRKAGNTQAVPVQVFPGSVEDALDQAALTNSHAKLNMTKDERANTAVRLTLLVGWSRNKTAMSSGVSRTLVGTIRQTINQLEAEGLCRNDMASMTWKELVRRSRKEDFADFDAAAAAERKAREILKVLRPCLPGDPRRHADALALALGMISKVLPQVISESSYWDVEEPEDLEDEGDDGLEGKYDLEGADY